MLIGPVRLHSAAHALARAGVPGLPTLLDYLGRFLFCCWLPHTVRVGRGLILGYGGLGIVVHSDSIIGDLVHIDQHVTIGGTGTRIGVPTIERLVYIGAGAKVLGPIKIGEGATIGANAVVLQDIPPWCLAVGVPARVLKRDPGSGRGKSLAMDGCGAAVHE